MFTFKPQKLIILCLSCSLLLTACYPSGGELLSTEDNAAISRQIENIVSNNENLQIDVQLNKTVEELPKINVKIMEWNGDKLKASFLEGKNNLKYEEYPANNDMFFPNDKRYLYDSEEYTFVYEPGFLLSKEYNNDVFGYYTMETCFNHYHFQDYFTGESINALSKQEAINRCTSLMKNIGITNYSEPEVFAITADKANKFWRSEEYDEYEEYKDWDSADDEIYILRFYIEYNDIPVTSASPNIVEGELVGLLVGTYMDFIITKDQIYSFVSYNIFSPEYENTENVPIKCSAENAVKIVTEHYDGISYEDNVKIKITDCKLVYAPCEWSEEHEKLFTLTPMWEVDVAKYDGEKLMGINDSMFIDVQTGNTVIW